MERYYYNLMQDPMTIVASAGAVETKRTVHIATTASLGAPVFVRQSMVNVRSALFNVLKKYRETDGTVLTNIHFHLLVDERAAQPMLERIMKFYEDESYFFPPFSRHVFHIVNIERMPHLKTKIYNILGSKCISQIHPKLGRAYNARLFPELVFRERSSRLQFHDRNIETSLGSLLSKPVTHVNGI